MQTIELVELSFVKRLDIDLFYLFRTNPNVYTSTNKTRRNTHGIYTTQYRRQKEHTQCTRANTRVLFIQSDFIFVCNVASIVRYTPLFRESVNSPNTIVWVFRCNEISASWVAFVGYFDQYISHRFSRLRYCDFIEIRCTKMTASIYAKHGEEFRNFTIHHWKNKRIFFFPFSSMGSFSIILVHEYRTRIIQYSSYICKFTISAVDILYGSISLRKWPVIFTRVYVSVTFSQKYLTFLYIKR